MELKERILSFMREEAYKPLEAEDLAAELELKTKELKEFWQALNQLEAEAAVIKTRYDKYGVPERMNLVVGRFEASRKGFGFVIPENPVESDVYIAPDANMNAMHNDRVVARVHHRAAGMGKTREGEVIRIVKRANRNVVGIFENSRNFGFVIPDDPRIGQDIFIPRDEINGAKNGFKVVVEITKWPEKKRSAEGKIVEVLGSQQDPGIQILSIIRSQNLPTEFPPEVARQVQGIPDTVQEAEIQGRRDLRDLPLVTIDSEDAKDLDDAVHVERLKNGKYLLGVHIADVSHYVKEGSPLDQEAQLRGTSVYLVDRVLPMLPHQLSNGICSLNAHVDRLALSAHMEIDERGRVTRYEIFPSIIHVKKRLSYNIVRKIIAEHDEELRQEYREMLPHLENMERLCRILRERRMRRGAIDFDFPELKVKLDDQGKPVEVVKRVRSIAESIVEEFMLVANETVAEHMHRLEIPFVFRVHEEPDPEKIVKLDNLLQNFGLSLNKASEIPPMALQKILSRIHGRPEERIISTVMLRSLKQARYEAENLGHFGLAAEFYTHFTSPIRRYPDLIVHRLIRESQKQGGISAKRREKLASMLPEIAFHASARERAAADAERETVDLKKAEYMAQFIGEEFEGIISSVTSFGLFIELPNGIEGLVHVSSMDDDYYQFIEEQYSLLGERTKKVYRLGEPVKVQVTKVNVEEKSIDFRLADTGNAGVFTRNDSRPRPVTGKNRRTNPPNSRGNKGPKEDKRKKGPHKPWAAEKPNTGFSKPWGSDGPLKDVKQAKKSAGQKKDSGRPWIKERPKAGPDKPWTNEKPEKVPDETRQGAPAKGTGKPWTKGKPKAGPVKPRETVRPGKGPSEGKQSKGSGHGAGKSRTEDRPDRPKAIAGYKPKKNKPSGSKPKGGKNKG
jgi:ribonuclease R